MFDVGHLIGFGAASVFSPSSLSGLGLWLDAADPTTITKDGSDIVSQWNDKSGNGYNAAQSSAAKPLWLSSGISGKGAVQFIATKYLSFSGGALNLLRNRTGYTVFMVVYPDSTPADTDYAAFLYFSKGDSSTALRFRLGLRLYSGPNYGTYHAWRRQDADSLAVESSTCNYWTVDTPYVLHSAADFTAGTLNTYRSDVAGAIVTSSVTTGTTSDTASAAATMGAPDGESANFRISELIIYQQALSVADQTKVNEYLKAKWAIT
jgi:hypothetical protein